MLKNGFYNRFSCKLIMIRIGIPKKIASYSFKCFSFTILFFFVSSCGEKIRKGTAKIPEYQKVEEKLSNYNEWLGHLGTHRNGLASGKEINFDWLESEPQLLWKKEIGVGVAGVSGLNEYVYSMGNVNGKDVIYCIDAFTGKIIWQKSYDCIIDKRMFEGGPPTTPLIDKKNKNLYTLSHQGELRCLSLKSGLLQWKVSYTNSPLGGRRPDYGYASSPIIYDDMLIISPGGKESSIAALNLDDGSVLWSCGNSKVGYSSPVIFTLNESDCIAQLNASDLSVFNLGTNSLLSKTSWETKYRINAAAPIYFNGHILITSGYGKGAGLFKVHEEKLELIYESKQLVCQFQSPIMKNGFIYAVTGDNDRKASLVCMNPINGKIMWSEPLSGNRGNVIAVDDSLIVLTERGEVIACSATPKSYNETGRFQAVGGRCWAAPTICGSRLYIRNNSGRLMCYNLKKN